MKKEEKDLKVMTKGNELVVSKDFETGGWDTEVVDTKDIIIPKILLMHPTSDLVKKGDRNQGEIIKSTSGELLAKRTEKIGVIIFEKWKEWRLMKKNNLSGRFEYMRLEAWTAENDSLPWEFEENGTMFRRDKTLNFYALLSSEAEAGNAFPVKLSFSRTGFKTGMKIADAYARALMEKQPPTRQIFNIGSELVTGKEETYFAFTVEMGKGTSESQRIAALQWRQVIQKAKMNNSIVEHEMDEETVTTVVNEPF